MKELDDLKKIFLAEDVDGEARAENEEMIRGWEKALIEGEAFKAWRAHDVTQTIITRAKESYRDISFVLATNRQLTEQERIANYAKQDAMLYLISIVDVDAAGSIQQIQSDIRRALGRV